MDYQHWLADLELSTAFRVDPKHINRCFIAVNTYCDINKHKTTKEIKSCQPVMTNEGPALESRALAQDLTKVKLSLPLMQAVAMDLVHLM